MVDSSPLGYGEPTQAAQLVILLLPDEGVRANSVIRADAPIILALPQPSIAAGPHGATAADPEFATCYQAEMPALISFLIKCGAAPDDAPQTAQDAFRRLFARWNAVDDPKVWLRKVAFPIFLRRPVRNAGNRDEPAPPGASSRFSFGEDEGRFIALTRLLPTTQRAVLALHLERFQEPAIAQILGLKPDTVRKSLKEARTTLMKSLNLNDNTWTDRGQPAEEPSAAESPAVQFPTVQPPIAEPPIAEPPTAGSPAVRPPSEGPSAEEQPPGGGAGT